MLHLVTGGAGFIGSHLVDRLARSGERVRVLDNLSTGDVRNIQEMAAVEMVHADVLDDAAVRRATRGVDYVYHHAAVTSVVQSIADPEATVATNVAGTLKLLIAARDAGCRRLILASSSAVYGNSAGLPKIETMAPHPLNPYAISKLTGEQLCAAFSTLHDLDTVVLRYFNVFGPRQDPNSPYAAVVPRFFAALRAGRAPTIFGDGEQSRDFVYVDNVVDALVRAATAEGICSRILNIAAGRAVTVNHLLAVISGILGIQIASHYLPAREGEIRDSLASISAAGELIGYRVNIPLEEGLQLTASAALSRHS